MYFHHSNWSAISLSRSDEWKTFIDSVKIMPLGLRRIVKTLCDKVEITSLHIVYQGVSSVKYRRFPMSHYNSSRFQTDGEDRYEQMTNHGC